MNIVEIARDAFRTARHHRALWALGFFAMAGGGTNFVYKGDEPAPSWLGPVIVAVASLGITMLVLRLVSEPALIEAVRRTRRGESPSAREALRTGTRFMGRVLGVQVTLGAAGLVLAALVAAPVLAAVANVVALPVGVALTGMLALVAAPIFVTLYFLYTYALRFVVLGDCGPIAAIGEATRFLAGRIAPSLKLALADALGSAGIQMLALPGAVLAALVATPLFFLVGPVPALIVFAVIVLPFAVAAVGAAGTYRSSLWTLAFLDEHPTLA